MLTGIYRINYLHFRHRGNAPTDYKQCTGNDGYTYFYCKFYMPNICSELSGIMMNYIVHRSHPDYTSPE